MGRKPQTTLSLEAFKEKVRTDEPFRNSFKRSDFIDYDHGLATFYRENLNKELEKFACKSEDDLSDFLWFKYGVLATVID